jgi:peptide deformylase
MLAMTPAAIDDMKAIRLVKWPSAILVEPAQEVPLDPDGSFRSWTAAANRIIEIIKEHQAQGLAANQANLPWRMMFVWCKVFINPVIEAKSTLTKKGEEGCLSLPGIYVGGIKRPHRIQASWSDLDGQRFSQSITGNDARIFQHELDHLNGLLISRFLKYSAHREMEEALAQQRKLHLKARV